MLVLSRRLEETIIIGDDIKVTVLGVSNGTVKIGIDAPKEIPVNREEIHKRIQAEENEGNK